MKEVTPLITVIMPTYNQAKFIRRAIGSLSLQTLEDWELIIVNDGSTDETFETVQKFLSDSRIKYLQNIENQGVGYSVNLALGVAQGEYIAYLPSDDIYYKDHLQSLLNAIRDHELAYSSYIFNYNKKVEGVGADGWLQPVQVLHRNNGVRWTDRSELETNDLNKTIWSKIEGTRAHTNSITCEWVDHPAQRHKIMREPLGGINTFRSFYNVKQPLIFHTTFGNFMDEKNRYKRFRKMRNEPSADGLKILIVGELAYNAERILALEERGHKLYGLWLQEPYWYNYVGPLPFGNVENVPYENWREEVKRIKPDVIYALLNFQVVPLAHEVLSAGLNIPFVWHFKEAPSICREKGTWNQLIDLYEKADGNIFTSRELKTWITSFVNCRGLSMVMDGDLAKKDWFTAERAPLFSKSTGEFHTVVAGRPIGLHPEDVAALAAQKIHLHFYGDFTQGQWLAWIEKTKRLAGDYIHIHPNVNQEDWVREFSRYDAGWLHYFQSENGSELTRANWDDLNIPARVSTYALCGLPMLQKDNEGHIVATQALLKEIKGGLFFNSAKELRSLLENETMITRIRENIWNQRHLFTFDAHADRLIAFFRKVMATVSKPANMNVNDY